jgi:lysophospholipid acyltransferase (LPLAT)-like uncharacterized protein
MAVNQSAEQTSETAVSQKAGRPAWKVTLLSFLVWLTARTIYSTLRIRTELSAGFREVMNTGEGAILVIWHGRTLIAANHFRRRGWWALISLSRDGEIQNSIFKRFGFQTIRGSTGRGGVKAAIQLARKVKEGGVLAFTPDGPRGPTHRVQQGTIFLAQRSGRPIIPFGISANPRKLLPTWDSYLIPYPFSRAAIVCGEPIYVAADADEEAQARFTVILENELNKMEQRAESLVGASMPVAQEVK